MKLKRIAAVGCRVNFMLVVADIHGGQSRGERKGTDKTAKDRS